MEQKAAIQPESVQLIFCEIPYDKGFLPQVSELAAMVYRVLAPGGILAVMSGICWEDETNAIFSQSFTRLHKLIAPWRGDGNVLQIKGMRVVNHYKPVLVYSKGKLATTITIGNDMLPEADQEEFWHEWQQPPPQVSKIIQYLSDEHDLVLDACGGSFITARRTL